MSLFNSYNRVVVMGNITRDIEIRHTPNQTAVSDVGLAINDRVKKGDEWVDEATFVDVTVWGKTAELLEQFGAKGKALLVEGRLKMDKWVDKESGQNRSKLKITADAITFVDPPKGGEKSEPVNDMPYATNKEKVPF